MSYFAYCCLKLFKKCLKPFSSLMRESIFEKFFYLQISWVPRSSSPVGSWVNSKATLPRAFPPTVVWVSPLNSESWAENSPTCWEPHFSHEVLGELVLGSLNLKPTERCSNPLNKGPQCLNITYAQASLYFKSSLDDLQ